MTMILVGTKSDKVFQSGFQHEDDDDPNKAQDAMFMSNQTTENLPTVSKIEEEEGSGVSSKLKSLVSFHAWGFGGGNEPK